MLHHTYRRTISPSSVLGGSWRLEFTDLEALKLDGQTCQVEMTWMPPDHAQVPMLFAGINRYSISCCFGRFRDLTFKDTSK